MKDQLALPLFTYTFDRLVNSFGVNLILTIFFTTCKIGIGVLVIGFWFGRGILGQSMFLAKTYKLS